MNELTKKTNNAIKWSAITEFLAKIISPLINMLLARILTPEAFGVLATITMVLSFAEVFVESGFQKFLIQYNFESKEQEHNYMTVAFWSNLAFSGVVWGIIIVFCDSLAGFAGNAGLGFPLAVASVAIPLYGIIGIQDCQLKKRLDFKSLFFVRIISAFVPLVVTLPLALAGFDYWSLIIGNIAGLVIRSALLVFLGKFKPRAYFKLSLLKHMLKVGIWTFLDGIALWATAWIDSLLIAQYMSEYYLGLYKHSSSTITSLFAIVTSALTPVLFSSLSKLQDNQKEFNKTFLTVQKTLCTFLLPLSVGVFLYRNFVTDVLFGEKWTEAANIVGIMAVTTAVRTIFVSFYSEAYRAKGKFYLPVFLQIADIAIIVPACIISVRYGFWSLVYTRAFIKLDLIIPEIICVWLVCKISFVDTIKNVLPPVISTVVMMMVSYGLSPAGDNVMWNLISIFICVIVYFSVLILFKKERETLFLPVIKRFRRGEK